MTFGAMAQSPKAPPKALGQFKDWGAYGAEVNGKKVCFVLSKPKDTSPKNVRRDPIFIFVTWRPAEGVREEVSVVAGYLYKEGSRAVVEIGSDKFDLFTKAGDAWIENGGRGGQAGQRHAARLGDGRQGHVQPRHQHHRPLFAFRRHCGAGTGCEGMQSGPVRARYQV